MFRVIKKRIYLDTASTTPVDSRVLKMMLPYFSKESGNPSSLHQEGVRARKAIEQSRQQIATLLSAHSDEIIFTSGGTESDNLAILGVARGLLAKNKIKQPGHIITTVIEHQAILESCRRLEKEGWRITYLPVSKEGLVDLVVLKEALCSETVLVSVMYANNEIGTVQPLREIAKILRDWRKLEGENRLPYFHTDACQAPRFFHFQVEKLGIDLMTLNGGKIYGPKGVGCLYVKRNTFIEPIIYGGGQESGWRSGTENVPNIIGLAEALKLATDLSDKETERLQNLRDYFIEKLVSLSPSVKINGSLVERLPNNVNVTFPGILGEWLVLSLDAKGIACSTGSACSSHHKDDAHVIMALGNNKEYAENTVRFSLDRKSNKKDIDYTIKVLKAVLQKSKNIIPPV